MTGGHRSGLLLKLEEPILFTAAFSELVSTAQVGLGKGGRTRRAILQTRLNSAKLSPDKEGFS